MRWQNDARGVSKQWVSDGSAESGQGREGRRAIDWPAPRRLVNNVANNAREGNSWCKISRLNHAQSPPSLPCCRPRSISHQPESGITKRAVQALLPSLFHSACFLSWFLLFQHFLLSFHPISFLLPSYHVYSFLLLFTRFHRPLLLASLLVFFSSFLYLLPSLLFPVYLLSWFQYFPHPSSFLLISSLWTFSSIFVFTCSYCLIIFLTPA